MPKGIVFEIENGNAVVMKNNGEFISVIAHPHWRQGDVVAIKAKTINLQRISIIAACFFVLISTSVIGMKVYFNESALISLDVNPSIELSINKFDRVIDVRALNDDGDNILDQTNVKNKLLDDAVVTLFEQGLGDYLQNNSLVTFTVYSPDIETQQTILSDIQNAAVYIYTHHANAHVELLSVDEATIDTAHEYNITAGKYAALRELQRVLPEIEIKNYSHHSISYIKEQTKTHGEDHHFTNPVENDSPIQEDNKHDNMQKHNDSHN